MSIPSTVWSIELLTSNNGRAALDVTSWRAVQFTRTTAEFVLAQRSVTICSLVPLGDTLSIHVSIKKCLTGLETNLDDLEAGIDANVREANRLERMSAGIDSTQARLLRNADLIGKLARQSRELTASVTDQRAVLSELRGSLARLRVELKHERSCLRSTLDKAADRSTR